MFDLKTKKFMFAAITLMVTLVTLLAPAMQIKAADHAEATAVAGDPPADIADVFVYLDPNDNSKVILAMDFEGFIVPSELLNLSTFAPDVVYRFEIENTNDPRPDQFIDITFSK